jgi:hypothetical protein
MIGDGGLEGHGMVEWSGDVEALMLWSLFPTRDAKSHV